MENAQLYSTASGMQRRDAEEVVKEFCGTLKWIDGARVLDIGCGTGEVTSEVLVPHLPKGKRTTFFFFLITLNFLPDDPTPPPPSVIL